MAIPERKNSFLKNYEVLVLGGPDKGVLYRVVRPEITIGRGTESDIVLAKDALVSRKHVRLKWTAEGLMVTDLSKKNKVKVNGREIETTILQAGDTLTVGGTDLKFTLPAMPTEAPLKLRDSPFAVAPSNGGVVAPVLNFPKPQARPQFVSEAAQLNFGRPSPPRSRRVPSFEWNPARLLILIAGIAIVWMFVSENEKSRKANVAIRTEDQIQADIEAANKMKDLAIQERQSLVSDSQASQEAQAAFVAGFRDYKKGQYSRALESFQACLSLKPDHVLCNRYVRVANRKFGELIQSHMVLGRKYRDQNQFSACASSFSNVMINVQDSNSKVYQEAKANYNACQARLGGRF